MSDHLAAEIFIGGPLPSRLAALLCTAIAAESVATEWGDAAFLPRTAADLLENRRDHHGTLVLGLCDDVASWGCFEELEKFLVAEGIPFDRYHEAKYEFDAELVCFRPGKKPTVIMTDADRKPVVRQEVVKTAQKQLAAVIVALRKQSLAAPLRAARSVERTLAKAVPQVPLLREFEIREEP